MSSPVCDFGRGCEKVRRKLKHKLQHKPITDPPITEGERVRQLFCDPIFIYMKNYLYSTPDPAKRVTFFDELPLWSAPFGWKLLDHIQYKSGITALDIGFGTGFPLIELAMRLGESATVYGIDPWKEAIERAKQKIDYYGISNVRIIEGVAESIPHDRVLFST